MFVQKGMQNFKKEGGITLIALIITIIVLVILAAVSINAAYNSGIVNYAVNGTGNYVEAAKKEEEYVQNANNLMASVMGQLDKIRVDVWDGTTVEVPEIDENGNWHINTAAQFKYFADFVNKEITNEDLSITENTTVYLEINLDLGAKWNSEGVKTSGTQWTPIGKLKDNQFIGIFDGRDHYIRGVYVNETTSYAGIFGNSNSIQNLTVRDSYIKGTTVTGGIVGALRNGTIENCHNKNTIVILIEGNYRYVGGVAGYLISGGKAVHCSNSGNIIGYGGYSDGVDVVNATFAGGVIGSSTSTGGNVIYCVNTGNVMANGSVVGGVIGQSHMNTNVRYCANYGYVSGADAIGGIVGQNQASPSFEYCLNNGTVTGSTMVGGIVGNTNQTVKNCYNTGVVESKNFSGGVTGRVYVGASLENCYNTGTISSRNGNVGSIAGNVLGEIKRCYALDSSASQAIATSDSDAIDYEILTVEEMKAADFLTKLNTENNTISNTGIWKQDTNNINNGYPILSWQ